MYTITTNSYTKYFPLVGKKSFPTQFGGQAAWISHLQGRKLKPKTIKGYIAGLRSLFFDCTLNITELELYRHLILQKIIAGLQKLYGKRDTGERWPITRDILLNQKYFDYLKIYKILLVFYLKV